MGGHCRDDNGPVGFPPQYFKTDCRDNSAKGKQMGMGVFLGGRGAGGDRNLANEGVRAEASEKNC